MILVNESSVGHFALSKLEIGCVCGFIPLFLYEGFFFKNHLRGFRYSIKDALAEIWKRFKVKSETR